MWPKTFGGGEKTVPEFYGGCRLEKMEKRPGTNVPEIICRITEVVEKHLEEESLYRKSGNKERVCRLRKTDPVKIDVDGLDVHDLTSWLKALLVDLKEPLIPKAAFREFSATYNFLKNKELYVAEVMEDINDTRRETLHHIMRHLLKVMEKAAANKMGKRNVCVVWAPVIYYPLESQEEADRCIEFFHILVDIYSKKMATTDLSDVTVDVEESRKCEENAKADRDLGQIRPEASRRSARTEDNASTVQTKANMKNKLLRYVKAFAGKERVDRDKVQR